MTEAAEPGIKRLGLGCPAFGYLSVFAARRVRLRQRRGLRILDARHAADALDGGLPWQESMKLPGSSQMQYVRKLIESRPMLVRIPDQSMLVSDANATTDRQQATRASDGSYALSTAPPARDRGSPGLHAGQGHPGLWYDPRTAWQRRSDVSRRPQRAI